MVGLPRLLSFVPPAHRPRRRPRTDLLLLSVARLEAREGGAALYRWKRHEEKETDVAVAAKLLELFSLNACDIVVLVTGDTDLAPAVRTPKVLWPHKQVWAAFPFGRYNAELKALVHGSIKVKANRYARYQLPNPMRVSETEVVWKPAGW